MYAPSTINEFAHKADMWQAKIQAESGFLDGTVTRSELNAAHEAWVVLARRTLITPDRS